MVVLQADMYIVHMVFQFFSIYFRYLVTVQNRYSGIYVESLYIR